MKPELYAAYQEWVSLFPGEIPGPAAHVHSVTKAVLKLPTNFLGDCPCSSHTHTVEKITQLADGKTRYSRSEEPAPDHKVCERERKWRAYVAVRDGTVTLN